MDRKKKFLLKDQLFNEEKVKKISNEIAKVYPNFKHKEFESAVIFKFPKLELLGRVYWIRDVLHQYLPSDYKDAVLILLTALPPEANARKMDDDFGDFIYASYGYFIAEYGCTREHFSFSLKALKDITTRFSVEGPIRSFINTFPKETFVELEKWTEDRHYHVRRLVSEGTRPLLPWAKKIDIPFTEPIHFLNRLYTDKTRFVTRSVANHINDISKIDSSTAIQLLKKWDTSKKQSKSEMQYIMKHGLRTLIKEGNKEALAQLGYEMPHIRVDNFSVHTPKVKIGCELQFSFEVTSEIKKSQKLMIDYIIYFNKANDQRKPKVFKITKTELKGNSTIIILKKHPMKVMTTRKLYSGEHCVELQINGKILGKKSFELL